ncbi:lipoyl protein ligase domain-containing protein [Pollutimonas harenae]|uniref:Lipoate--protein ligase family protein n=1 Tax=Pollutimonas harenae TaxID=657015 RepID=A0A853GWT1_9BURK|nr:lipoate--protein ligase family protein [Pollutimonas harenae]NYT86811.1 lipoate--protein ligase family protein [Pollutimonas harenae]TEA71457.1 lipoate--protein ligase family protein [Pollutimonas harenae]
MPFALLSYTGHEPQHARFDESLIALAAQQGPCASIWEAEQGLVVPRTYRRYVDFEHACQQSEQAGWPVTVRHSGGGIVPQGPGIINLSLAYSVHGKPLDHSDAAYQLICNIISTALQAFGIASHPQAVEGSFCDGRYNLAVGEGTQARKIAGTAQMWRRHPTAASGSNHQIVLVHALILAQANMRELCTLANHFEQMLGSNKCYDSERVASLHAISDYRESGTKPWISALRHALEQQVKQLP